MKKQDVAIVTLLMLLLVTNILWVVYVFHPFQVKTWHQVASWNGIEDLTTESFDISSDYWRVKKRIEGSGSMWIYLYESFSHTEVEYFSMYNIPEVYLNRTGRFYMKISVSSQAVAWNVTVEEFR